MKEFKRTPPQSSADQIFVKGKWLISDKKFCSLIDHPNYDFDFEKKAYVIKTNFCKI